MKHLCRNKTGDIPGSRTEPYESIQSHLDDVGHFNGHFSEHQQETKIKIFIISCQEELEIKGGACLEGAFAKPIGVPKVDASVHQHMLRELQLCLLSSPRLLSFPHPPCDD